MEPTDLSTGTARSERATGYGSIALRVPTWTRARQILRSELGDDVFGSWFARIELDSVIDGIAQLSVPTRFLRNWLEAHYTVAIAGALRRAQKDIYGISLRVRSASSQTAAIAGVLGGEEALGRKVGTLTELRRAVDEGLPKITIANVAKFVAKDVKAQREVIYGIIPAPTFKRRRERLSPAESERTERLARTVALTFDIWGEDDGRLFLSSPHPLLGGDTPIEAAATDLGAREVELILRAIEFGLPV